MAISGFVVTYNRAALLGTCLRSMRFVDELIVIDKSSTDASTAHRPALCRPGDLGALVAHGRGDAQLRLGPMQA